jgi:hypothetical protein
MDLSADSDSIRTVPFRRNSIARRRSLSRLSTGKLALKNRPLHTEVAARPAWRAGTDEGVVTSRAGVSFGW